MINRRRAVAAFLAGLLVAVAVLACLGVTGTDDRPSSPAKSAKGPHRGPKPHAKLEGPDDPDGVALKPPPGTVRRPPGHFVVGAPDSDEPWDTDLPWGRVTGVVVDTQGRPIDNARVVGEGCGPKGDHVAPPPGHTFAIDVWGPCLLRATRRDGLLFVRSNAVEVEPGDDVELVFPAERTGGMGIQIRPVADGIVAERVYPGTPADRLGLRDGDVIVSVDGMPAAAMSMEDFIANATGPEGTIVEIEVLHGGDTGAEPDLLRVRRAFLDQDGAGNVFADPVDTGD